MFATIEIETTDEIGKEIKEPWSNYNVLVLDQRSNGNSSVSLFNTSNVRDGSFRDANVTELLWLINNKKSTYNFYRNLHGSWVMTNETKFGTKNQFGFGKIDAK